MKLKRYIFLSLAFVFIFLSFDCTNVDVNYNNPFDTQSDRYSPPGPTWLDFTFVGDTAVSIVWNDVSYGESGFVIERRINPDGSYEEVGKVESNITSFVDKIVLKPETLYLYRVAAFTKNAHSKYTANAHYWFFYVAPSKPAVTVRSKNSFEIEWIDNVKFSQGFYLQKSIDNGTYNRIATLSKNQNSYTDNAVDTLHTYSYRVMGFTKYNHSGYSPITQMTYNLAGYWFKSK